MGKLELFFKLAVIEFISDWYSVHKVAAKNGSEIQGTFKTLNRLKGVLRTELEKDEYDNRGG